MFTKKLLAVGLVLSCSSQVLARPLSMDDVLATVSAERATISPDGESIAIVVQRPAGEGEVHGRNAYEIDPSRSDVWLISRHTGETRNLTDGAKLAAGFWCPYWSPDGRRLAMLSTMPENHEPRGGDNVRLYVWDSMTGILQRVGDWPVMTQTRYGASIQRLDVRGGADGDREKKTCHPTDEGAPFAWLDDARLILATLPESHVSALLDAYGRPFDHASTTRLHVREGKRPTFTADGSGAERIAFDQETYAARIRLVDTEQRSAEIVATVPNYPFFGGLALNISPDRRRVGILATEGMIDPAKGAKEPWMGKRRLGVADLAGMAGVRWTDLPVMAGYPDELLGWSSGSASLQFSARGDPAAGSADPFTLTFADGVVSRKSPAIVEQKSPSKPRATRPAGLGRAATLLADAPARDVAVWRDSSRKGTRIIEARTDGSRARTAMELNSHLAQIDWGELRLIDYNSLDGQPLRGMTILPPGFDSSKRYPLLVWVYPGTRLAHFAYWSDPYLPGIYNLQLYAARGYVVLVPSMPRGSGAQSREIKANLLNGVLPAVDRLVELGIADPDRVGVFGQSWGGYATYSLVTQTNRFKAAVAVAGTTDYTLGSFLFDPTARGYPGIGHEKSVLWSVIEHGYGFDASPVDAPDLYRRNSPLFDAKQIETPLMMIHGEFDIMGGLEHSEAMFSSLYRQGKTARLLRYWGESHSLALSPANVRSAFEEIVAWFDKYLK